MGYILTEAEYKALDKAFTKSEMADDGQMIYQYKGCDYFAAFDEDYVSPFQYLELTPRKPNLTIPYTLCQ